MKTVLLLVVVIAALGCSGGPSEVSKEKDEDLRNNMTRSLTAEEIAKMGGSGVPGPAENPSGKKAPATK